MEYCIRPYRPEDAEAVAKMWNESLPAWPMAFGGGTPFTAARVRAWLEETRLIACELAVADDGRVLGLCELVPSPKGPEAAHVYLLNVDPAYHGSGVGKSLLRRAVERAIALGVRRLDLDTWPANLKAIPLYKKCGFFWVPGTAVYMQNYLPLIAQQTPAREFFAAHDWYRCFVRAVEATEDEEEWEGKAVFHYLWREGEEVLRCIIDRATGGITAVETGRWEAVCRGEEAQASGRPQVLWRLVNKGHRPLVFTFTLAAQSEARVGSELTLSGTLNKDWEHRVEAGPKERITTRLELGRDRVELETAVEPKPPLDLTLSPDPLPVYLGREIRAYLCLQNNLPAAVRGRVTLAEREDLGLECLAVSFDLPPHGRGAWPVVLRPRVPGAHHLEGLAECMTADGKKRRLDFKLPAYIATPGVTVTGVEADYALLETVHLRLRVEKRGGMMTFFDRHTGKKLGRQPIEALGPPFWPNEFEAAELELRAESNKVCVIASSRLYPGLVMEKSIAAENGPLLAVSYRVSNHGPLPLNLRMAIMPSGLAPGRRLAIPAKEGLILEKLAPGHFPDGPGLPREPEKWRETWCSVEEDGQVFRVIWQGTMTQAALPWAEMVPLVLALPAMAPGSAIELSPLYYFVGEGDYRSVRRYWYALVGKEDGRPEDLSPRRSLEAYFRGSVIAYGTEGRAVLHFSNLHHRHLSGKLRIFPPPGWHFVPAELNLPMPERDEDFSHELKVSCEPEAPAAGGGELRLEAETLARSWTFSCLKLGDGGAVIAEKEADGIWRVENGWLGFRVAPRFVGSCYGIYAGGINHLLSAYPASNGTFATVKPWYGGIHPFITAEGEKASSFRRDEQFEAERSSRQGSHGLIWQGVRVTSSLEQPGLLGLRISLEYLTLGRSNFMAVVLTLHNTSSAPMACEAGVANYLLPGGEVSSLLLRYPDEEGSLLTRTRHAGYAEIETAWAVLENLEKGWAWLALAPAGRFRVLDRKAFGLGLDFRENLRLAPGEEARRFYYLVLLRTPVEHEPYLELLRWQEVI
ncbi:MAG: GNAT family N-acetyltransferase [Bacillota bacterium]